MALTDDQFARIHSLCVEDWRRGIPTVKGKVEAIIDESSPPPADGDDVPEGYSISEGADGRWYAHECDVAGVIIMPPVRRSLDRGEVMEAINQHIREWPTREARRLARQERRRAATASHDDGFGDD